MCAVGFHVSNNALKRNFPNFPCAPRCNPSHTSTTAVHTSIAIATGHCFPSSSTSSSRSQGSSSDTGTSANTTLATYWFSNGEPAHATARRQAQD